MDSKMIWDEPLPEDCPPNDSRCPQNEKFYRLVEGFPPTDRDFWSHRKLYPNKGFHANECIARSCSLLLNLSSGIKLLKLPTHRSKTVVELTLPPHSGVVKNTGKSSDHYSWWRASGFDPISCCSRITI